METKILENLGLTPGEIKVYFAMLKLGQATTGPLSKESGVSRSKVYPVLNKLTEKGLAGHLMKGKVHYFSAMPPKQMLSFIEQKESALQAQKRAVEKIIPELELQQSLQSLKTEATLFQGFQAIKNFYLNLLKDLKPGESYYVLGAGYGPHQKATRAFFQRYHTQRAAKRIHVMMLANHNVKGTLVSATQRYSEIRYLPQNLITDMTIIFYHNKAFLFFLTKNPLGFLIENNDAVNSFRKYFETFWKSAKR